jgi:archaellum biogenesis ATPase FlaH
MGAIFEPVLLTMRDVQSQPIRWLWENRVPLGKVTIFAGDPGLGKSFVALDLAARVSSGEESILRKGDVILLSAEDDPADTIRPRLDASGADVAHVHVLNAIRIKGDSKQSQRMVRLDRDIEQIAEAIRVYPETILVIIDPLSAYMGSVDAKSDEQVRSILAPLAELASKTGVAIVCIKHLNKAEEKSAIYRAGGSIGFIAAARMVWMFAKDRNDSERRLMLLTKSNIGTNPGGLAYRIEQTESGPCVMWEPGTVQMDLDDALRPATHRKSAVDTGTKWLADVLANGPVSVKDVEKAAAEEGLSWATVRRSADSLKISRKHEGFGPDSQWKWSLP